MSLPIFLFGITADFKPKNVGIIVRTTAQGKNQEILTEEFNSLMKMTVGDWDNIKK